MSDLSICVNRSQKQLPYMEIFYQQNCYCFDFEEKSKAGSVVHIDFFVVGKRARTYYLRIQHVEIQPISVRRCPRSGGVVRTYIEVHSDTLPCVETATGRFHGEIRGTPFLNPLFYPIHRDFPFLAAGKLAPKVTENIFSTWKHLKIRCGSKVTTKFSNNSFFSIQP